MPSSSAAPSSHGAKTWRTIAGRQCVLGGNLLGKFWRPQASQKFAAKHTTKTRATPILMNARVFSSSSDRLIEWASSKLDKRRVCEQRDRQARSNDRESWQPDRRPGAMKALRSLREHEAHLQTLFCGGQHANSACQPVWSVESPINFYFRALIEQNSGEGRNTCIECR